MIPLFHI